MVISSKLINSKGLTNNLFDIFFKKRLSQEYFLPGRFCVKYQVVLFLYFCALGGLCQPV